MSCHTRQPVMNLLKDFCQESNSYTNLEKDQEVDQSHQSIPAYQECHDMVLICSHCVVTQASDNLKTLLEYFFQYKTRRSQKLTLRKQKGKKIRGFEVKTSTQKLKSKYVSSAKQSKN